MYKRLAEQFTFGFVVCFAVVALIFAITSDRGENLRSLSFMLMIAFQLSVLAGVLNAFADGPPHDKEDRAA